MLMTKEHYELMAAFERDCKGMRFDKESKTDWVRGIIYQHGLTNQMFLIYRKGYALGKFVQQSD